MRNAVSEKDTNAVRGRKKKVEREIEGREGLIRGLGLENLTDLL